MRKELKELMLTRAAWSCVLILIIISARTIIFFKRDPATLTFASIAGHEWEYNIWRIMGMANALMDGMPGRWLEAFSHGWGYPLFHYTGPLPYFLGGPLVLLGFEPHAALNVCWIAGYAFAGIAMFWAMQPFLGRWGAVLATCCYLLAPYHLVDTYVRTNLAETWAFIPPPLIIGGLLRARSAPIPGIATGSLGVMLLPLIHLLSFYIVGISVGIFCLLYLLLLPTKKERIAFLISATAVAAIGLGLSAFFWLPAFADIPAIKGFEAMKMWHYSDHFVYLQQLFSSFWHYGGSEPGLQDYMSFSLGQPIAAFGMLALGISLYRLGRSYWLNSKSDKKTIKPKLKLKKGKKTARPKRSKKPLVLSFDLCRLVIAVALSTAITAFLTLNASSGLWDIIPGISAVQFPWRFLLPASAFLAITAGALPRLLAELNRKFGATREPVLAVILCLTVVGLHWNFARVGDYGVSERKTLMREGLIELGVWTTSALEFLPKTSLQIPYVEMKRQGIALFYDENMNPQPRIVKETLSNGIARITLLPGNPGTLVLNQHWHPAWNASIDGEAVDAFAFPWHPFGPVAVTVPQDAYAVEFRYGYTVAGYFGVLLSLATLLGAFAYLLKQKKHRQIPLAPAGVLCLTPILLWHLAVTIPNTSTLADRIDGIGKEVSVAELPATRHDGGSWDEPGNAIFDDEGLRVFFDQPSHDNAITLSTDSNDEYLVLYLNGDKVLGRGLVPKRDFGGLSSATLSISHDTAETGYDSIVIFPITGDGYYSLGHIQTHSEQTTAIADNIPQDNTPVPDSLPLEQVSAPRPQNISWDAPGNHILQPQKELRLTLDKPHHATKIELSVDSNDYYFVKYLLANKFLGGHLIQPVQGYGLAVHRVEVPEKVRESGFDVIGIIPLSGDDRYSLGYLLLQDWWTEPEAGQTQE